MKPFIPILLFYCLLLIDFTSASEQLSSPTLIQSLKARIENYHKDSSASRRVLNIVYFVPPKVEPQKNYRERITRIMLDIQEFFQDEMERNGFGPHTFPLDFKDGELNIHLVQGQSPSSLYSHESGQLVKWEVKESLKEVFDLDKEFTLIICGMCEKKEDGSYFFYAPYYGDAGSNHRWGLCYVADCELQDPALLKPTKEIIRYEEHYGTYKQTLAKFNTKYLGGIAHELGHGLSLPHNGESDEERAELGTALMGSGNHTYRRERWTKFKGSFLTPASAIRLASHPLFTQSDFGNNVKIKYDLSNLEISKNGSEIIVKGQITGNPEIYAVIAYLDPNGRKDYEARTFVAQNSKDGFDLKIKCSKTGNHQLRIVACHLNGAVSQFYKSDLKVGKNLVPDVGPLMSTRIINVPVKLFMDGDHKEAISEAKTILQQNDLSENAKRKLNHLINLKQNQRQFESPNDLNSSEAFLSDLKWEKARVGWGKPARNHYYFDRRIQDALFLELDGEFYEKGLYAHAPSQYIFKLDKKFKRFKSIAGLQSGTPDIGTAVFVVKGDGKELFRSKVLKGNQTANIDISIEEINQLVLIVESGKEGNACCWSIWAEPKIIR